MIGLEGKTLSSERLRYRLMQSSDKVTLSELLSDAEVTRTAGFLPAKTQKDFDDFFAALKMYNTCIAIQNGASRTFGKILCRSRICNRKRISEQGLWYGNGENRNRLSAFAF